uniref:Ig-like domain-containing protein n=1 Tax=Massilia sp. TaxID=1882437 RepID=UPI00289A597B
GPNNPGGTSGTSPGGGSVTAGVKVTATLVDGAGNAVASLSGGQSATLRATVLQPDGKPAVGAIVSFATSAPGLVAFTPDTATALTDANGVAVVTVKPASYTASGAAALSATSVVEGKTGTAGLNIAIGAAPLTVGTLSFNPEQKTALPAFNTVALHIPITSAGQPATVATGLSLTSLCVGDGTATLVPGAMSNGVQVATYTNNGCTRGRDTITAAIGSSSQSISLDVSAANIGSIGFASSNLSGTSIVLKGSGGQGRSESAQLTFRVVDQQNNGLAGVDVDFTATTYTGGLSVSPTRATTDANGNVTTMVSSGTIPTPVRVMATATRNGNTITGLSDALTVSTGLPIQRWMSMSAEHYNIEGGEYDGETVGITVRLADQYGNPVSDGTAVNFVTEGGAVGSSAQGGCTTTGGGCSVDLVTQDFRPANGRVTVLAYVQGIENFVDLNGDGQYSCSGYAGAPGSYRPLVDACPGGGEPFPAAPELGDMGDPFLDTNENGIYEPAKGDRPFPFNHANYVAAGDGKWGLNYLRKSIVVVFSGSTAKITQFCQGAVCDTTPRTNGAVIPVTGAAGANCALQNLSVRLADGNGNPLPYGTTVTVPAANKVAVGAVSPGTINSTVDAGGTVHLMTVTPEAACAAGDFTLQVKTPKGNITEFKFTAN